MTSKLTVNILKKIFATNDKGLISLIYKVCIIHEKIVKPNR